MGKGKRTLKSGSLALAAVVAGFMFNSSAHAVIAGEAHACNADSASGSGAFVGDYYFAGSRSSRTYLYEYVPVDTYVITELWAYPQGGGAATVSQHYVLVEAGGFYGEAGVIHHEPETARGSLLSFNFTWGPTGFLAGDGFWIPENAPVNANGCASQTAYY